MSGLETSPPLAPALPLILWNAPPGLVRVLEQEGVPHLQAEPNHPAGRFVITPRRWRSGVDWQSLGKIVLDLDQIRLEVQTLLSPQIPAYADPFQLVIKYSPTCLTWRCDRNRIVIREQAARWDTGLIRRAIVTVLARRLRQAGGLWIGLGCAPWPCRSVFGFRLDLDEPIPDDSTRVLDRCVATGIAPFTTVYLSTAAYFNQFDWLAQLPRWRDAGIDVQSHGHHHYLYREQSANHRNLVRARAILSSLGVASDHFAAPGGRWNPGLNRVLEDLAVVSSSEFALGRDDRPFRPWLASEERWSQVWQVPVHPVCEGLFLEAGHPDPEAATLDHFSKMIRARVAQGEPVFLYGHPERRLARFLNLVKNLADEVFCHDSLWRASPTDYLAWWRRRALVRFQVDQERDRAIVLRFKPGTLAKNMALIVDSGDHIAREQIDNELIILNPNQLCWQPRPTLTSPEEPVARVQSRDWSVRRALRQALDYERVTPIGELEGWHPRTVAKRWMRRWSERRAAIPPSIGGGT